MRTTQQRPLPPAAPSSPSSPLGHRKCCTLTTDPRVPSLPQDRPGGSVPCPSGLHVALHGLVTLTAHPGSALLPQHAPHQHIIQAPTQRSPWAPTPGQSDEASTAVEMHPRCPISRPQDPTPTLGPFSPEARGSPTPRPQPRLPTAIRTGPHPHTHCAPLVLSSPPATPTPTRIQHPAPRGPSGPSSQPRRGPPHWLPQPRRSFPHGSARLPRLILQPHLKCQRTHPGPDHCHRGPQVPEILSAQGPEGRGLRAARTPKALRVPPPQRTPQHSGSPSRPLAAWPPGPADTPASARGRGDKGRLTTGSPQLISVNTTAG